MFSQPESTRVVSLMLTWACNLNCTYCFEKFKTKGREMTVNMAKSILSKEFEMMRGQKSPGKLKVEFFGGEPLLKFDVIRQVTEWIEQTIRAWIICCPLLQTGLCSTKKKRNGLQSIRTRYAL